MDVPHMDLLLAVMKMAHIFVTKRAIGDRFGA